MEEIEILKEILAELRYLNSRNREMDERLKTLEARDTIYSAKEAKEYLGVSYYTLRQRKLKGYLTLVTRGCKTGYLLSELKKVKRLKPN